MANQNHLFAVCDGHGVNGHLVSQFVKNMLPKMLEGQLSAQTEIKQSLEAAFLITNQLLRTSSEIDCTFSGTTTVLCLIQGDELYVANVGDSRAIISQNTGVKPISRDHKPDSTGEHERIIAAGGRVENYHDQLGNPVGPARVWLAYFLKIIVQIIIPQDARASYGQIFRGQWFILFFKNQNNFQLQVQLEQQLSQVIIKTLFNLFEQLEIIKYELSQKDKFMVIASDGVFEFLSNEQVAAIVEPFYKQNQPDKAADKLVKEATIQWQKEDGPIDDITCIVIFFLQENKGQ